MADSDQSLRPDQILNQDYQVLDEETRSIVRGVVGACRRSGGIVRRAFRDGEVSAWPHPGGGVAWDVHRPTLDGPRGVQRLPADHEPVITGIDELQTLAGYWQAIDLDRLSQNPLDTKEALAGVHGQLRAVRRWASTQDDAKSGVEAARCQTAIAFAAEELKALATKASTRPDWIAAFDGAGWPDQRRSVLSAIGGLIEGLVDAVSPARARAAPGEDANTQTKQRRRG